MSNRRFECISSCGEGGKNENKKWEHLIQYSKGKNAYVFNSCNFVFRMYMFLLVDVSASLCGWSKEIKSLLKGDSDNLNELSVSFLQGES